MRSLPPAVLWMETIVVLLIIPAVAARDDDVALGAGLAAALAVCLALAAVLARRPAGIVLGSVLQLPLVATGLIAWPMWVLGVIFAGLWGAAVQSARSVPPPATRS